MRIGEYAKSVGLKRDTIHKRIAKNKNENVSLKKGLDNVSKVEFVAGIYILHVSKN